MDTYAVGKMKTYFEYGTLAFLLVVFGKSAEGQKAANAKFNEFNHLDGYVDLMRNLLMTFSDEALNHLKTFKNDENDGVFRAKLVSYLVMTYFS